MRKIHLHTLRPFEWHRSFLPIEIGPRLSALFPTKAPGERGQASATQQDVNLPSSDGIKVMTGHGGGEEGAGGRGGIGGSCFDSSKVCVLTKTAEISMLPPPSTLHTQPTLTLAQQLNPSLCVPHSWMDLSAIGHEQRGIGRAVAKRGFFVRELKHNQLK